ncbi:MAG: hypothetical protein LBH09_03890 [Peptococcaceae bacterium]|jgi:hypothetical protein|nr:hypothetical protein [Peptococcaceae bacterium]
MDISVSRDTRDFDFERYNLLIVFGREMIGLEYAYGGEDIAIAYDSEYKGNVVFFYQVEKLKYRIPIGVFCYMMDGDEKTYVGDPLCSAFITLQKL